MTGLVACFLCIIHQHTAGCCVLGFYMIESSRAFMQFCRRQTSANFIFSGFDGWLVRAGSERAAGERLGLLAGHREL